MLLRFGVANHLSISDPQELSFVATKLRDPDDGLLACDPAPSGSVLPAVVIYGANASGKSNLVDAIATMRSMILLSHTKGDPLGPVPRRPFMLDPERIQQPSHFDIDFIVDGVRYHYGFESSDTAFVSEWLYAFPRSYRRTLFERSGDTFRFGRGLSGQNSSIARLTRSNSLYLSAAAQNDHEQLSKIFEFFSKTRTVRDIAIPGAMVSAQLENEGLDRRIIDFLQKVGTGVVGYRRNETKVPEKIRTLHLEISAVLRKLMNAPADVELRLDDKQVSIELAHLGRDGTQVYFEMDQESTGTRRLLVLLDQAFRALDSGVPLYIDELEASLHTHAGEAVLQLFCSPKTNPKGAQLLATTHDTNLMMSSKLRRDQVWFVDKDSDGATQIRPLTDIRTRKNDDLETAYLQGRYGAVPFNDPLAALASPK